MLRLVSIVLLALSFFITAYGEAKADLYKMLEKMHWSGQASWRIERGEENIYIDPLKLPANSPKAELIFVTHSHGDHLSPADIQSIATKNTILIGPKSCEEKLKSTGIENIQLVNPEDTLKIMDIPVIVVPAYNVKKTDFHPKENSWVGYILEIDGVNIYHAGDTERIPEMKTFDCDIALVPLGQTYTMNSVEEAVKAILDIQPQIAIPMHYGIYEGKIEDAVEFKKLLTDKIEVVIYNSEK